ncbi:MAG: hypothetical protein JXQ90_02545 [Cyclobacteriaceae bacterium]
MSSRSGKYSILFAILLMIALVVIIGTSISAEQEQARTDLPAKRSLYALPTESGVFALSESAMDYKEVSFIPSERTLDEYYERRAYPGAPPTIPHAVIDEKGMGGKDCLQCHQSGGYVAQFKAYAPVTPHANFMNCRQCHVPTKMLSEFRKSNFSPADRPTLGQKALLSSPPKIPHGLQMRENCLACHASPSAPKEIRVSHPERVNCRQCHAAPQSEISWTRLESTTSNSSEK